MKRPLANGRSPEKNNANARPNVRRIDAARVVPAGLFLGLFVCLFFPLIFGSSSGARQFCLRDSGFFYYPLYRQIQAEWDAGRAPLWDPYENLGQPLAANPTSGVFYPGKAIFFLPRIAPVSYGFCYKWFIMLHLPLAFWGAFRLARRLKISREGGALAAFAYAFGGATFSQTANPIFLIGAAWTPWILTVGDRLVVDGRPRDVLAFALALAMPTLAGDVEASYLAVLFLVARTFFVVRSNDAAKNADGFKRPVSAPFARLAALFRRSALVRLAAASVLGGLVAAATVLPAAGASGRTNRQTTAPASIWELPRALFADAPRDASANDAAPAAATRDSVWDGILCRDWSRDEYSASIYRNSLPPWRLPELVWPEFSGLVAPVSTRWGAFWSGCDDDWSTSISIGILPFVFLLATVWERRRPSAEAEKTAATSTAAVLAQDRERRAIRRWLLFSALFFLLGSLGGFGLGWLARAISSFGSPDWDPRIQPGDPVGGVYWLATVFLPKFAIFRYPAKLAVPATAAAALLAGLGFDRCFESRRVVVRIAFALTLLTGVGLLVVAIWGRGAIASATAKIGDPYLATKAFGDLYGAFVQTLAVLLFFGAICWRRPKKTAFFVCVLAATAFDLGATNRTTTPTVSQRDLDAPTYSARALSEAFPDRAGVPIRVFRDVLYNPFDWLFSDRRIGDRALWDKTSFAAKFPYRDGIGVLSPRQGTFLSGPLAKRLADLETRLDDAERTERALRELGVDVAVASDLRAGRFPATRFDAPKNVRFPIPTPDERDPADDERELNDVWPRTIVARKVRDARRIAIRRDGRDAARDGESAQIVDYSPNRTTFVARLTAPGTVELAEQYWPGWTATVAPVDAPNAAFAAPVETEDGVLRAIRLGAGTWRVETIYRPREVFFGVGISAVATLVVLAALVGTRRGRRQSRFP